MPLPTDRVLNWIAVLNISNTLAEIARYLL